MGWQDVPLADAAERLRTNTASGLDASEVRRRLAKFGPNAPEGEPVRGFAASLPEELVKLPNVLLLLGIAVAAVAAFTGSLGAGAALGMLALLAVRLVIGLLSSAKTAKNRRAVERAAIPPATFLRERKKVRRSSAEAVPGDIIVLRAGDAVCADARIIEADRLGCSEAALFGSAETVYKNPYSLPDDTTLPSGWTDMVFAGSFVVCGSATALVVATGKDTLLRSQESGPALPTARTPLERACDSHRRRTVLPLLGVCAAAGIISAISGDGGLSAVALSLTAAAAALPLDEVWEPESAYQATSAALVKTGVTVKSKAALEKCAAVSAVFTDIFDLYTEGEFSVAEFWTPLSGGEQTPLDRAESQTALLKMAVLALGKPDRAWQSAVFEAMAVRSDPAETLALFKREFGFGFADGATAILKDDRMTFAVTAASLKTLAGHCASVGKAACDAAEEMESRGLRVYAVAMKRLRILPVVVVRSELECDMRLVGLLGVSDSLKPSAVRLMGRYREAGISPVIISTASDAMVSAYAVKMGLAADASETVDGEKLDDMSHAELEEELGGISVYSELDERARLRVIKAWRNAGRTVAAEFSEPSCAGLLRAADVGFSDSSSGLCEAEAKAVSEKKGCGSPLNVALYARFAVSAVRRGCCAATVCGVSTALTAVIFAVFGWVAPPAWLLLFACTFAQWILIPALREPSGEFSRAPASALAVMAEPAGLRALLSSIWIIGAAAVGYVIGGGAGTACSFIAFTLSMYMTALCGASEGTLFAAGKVRKKLALSLAAAAVFTASAVLVTMGVGVLGWKGAPVSGVLGAVALGLGALPVGELIKLLTGPKKRTSEKEEE